MKSWLGVFAAVFFLSFIFFVEQFPLSVEEVTQNVVSQSYWQPNPPAFGEFLTDSGRRLFALPDLIKSVLPDILIYSPQLHRLPNLILAIISILLLHRISQNKILTVLSLVCIPWFIYSSVFDFSGLLTLALFFALFATNSRPVNFFVLICLSFASLPGLLAALVLSLIRFQQKVYLLALAAILSSLIFRSPIQQLKATTFFGEDDYSLARASFEVDQRVREETRINNYRDIFPLSLKRLSYNKYYFWLTKIAVHFTKILNLEYLSSPAQIHTTVSKNLWREKRLPLVLFWQLPLIFIGLLNFSQLERSLKQLVLTGIVVSIVATGLSIQSQFETQGLLIVIPFSILMVLGLQKIMHWKLVTISLGLIAIVGLLASYHHFLLHELYWRDNRPFVFTELVKTIGDTTQPVTVSNVLGPTHFYYVWLTRTNPQKLWQSFGPEPQIDNVKFRHFDLSSEQYLAGTFYIGLPGEFLGNRGRDNKNDFSPYELPNHLRLKTTIPIKDAVSYGNGNFIWSVEAL